MNISAVKPTDIVKCDVRGREFHGIVERGPYRGEADGKQLALDIRPIEAGITYTRVTARQVTVHFRRLGRER